MKNQSLAKYAVALSFSLLTAVSSGRSEAQSFVARYLFNNDLQDDLHNAQDLKPIGSANTYPDDLVPCESVDRYVLGFPANGGGVELSPAPPTHPGLPIGDAEDDEPYMIRILFRVANPRAVNRILEFATDNYVYITGGNSVAFSNGGAGGIGPQIPANQYVEITMTRDSSTQQFTCYLDTDVCDSVAPVHVFSFIDDAKGRAAIKRQSTLRFFTRGSGGRVAELILDDDPLRHFLRGETSGDMIHGLADAVRILDYLFRGMPMASQCEDAADINDDGRLNVADAIGLLNWLFRGAAPPPGLDQCTGDATLDNLGCDEPSCSSA